MTCAIGIDVGGTKIAVGLVHVETAEIVSCEVVPTDADRPPLDILADCVRLAERRLPADAAAVGIGVCELVDRQRRVTSANCFDWRGVDIAGALEHIAPVVVESDMRAAAVAEARFGAGRGAQSFLYVGIGSGVACAFVDRGEVLVGARGYAMFLGTPDLEKRSGGLALNRRLGPDLSLAFDNETHRPVVRAAADDIGHAIGIVVNALDPEMVVLGGGVGRNAVFCGLVADAVRPLVYSPETALLPIRAGELDLAGMIGAALRAIDSTPANR